MVSSTGGHVTGLLKTDRKDAWWLGPALTAGGLGSWGIYYFLAAFSGKYYAAGPYVSPFFITYVHGASPDDMSPGNAWFGYWPDSWPLFVPPALIMGMLPGMFRMTCYYYRKAYYRAFFGMPPGCSVGPLPHNYQGETSILVFQNLHRFTLYIAIALLPLLYLDAWHSIWLDGRLGFGIGSVLLGANAILLTGYTFGCHAWRHLVGGKLNCFSCDGASEARHGIWGRVTWLNERHQEFAWASLICIALCDMFIRSVSMGFIPDLNTWHGVTWIAAFAH